VAALLVLGTFLYALWTSGLGDVATRTSLAIGAVALAATIASQATGGDPGKVIFAIAYGVLCAAALCALLVRLIPERRVSTRILAAAVTIYLLLGLMFAEAYQIIGEVLSEGFFAQAGNHTIVSYLYFSFITLTSVGYGDLTPRGGLGQMLSALEALSGQLYLVTVIAVVVSQRPRRSR
jgi:hypothetical protein